MAPTKPKLEKTNVGEEVLDLVLPFIHNVQDRNSVSLVSRKSYETDGITRKRLTVHTLYYPNPASLSKRFPFIESLTLTGPPSNFNVTDDYDIQFNPWIEHVALEFRCLQELRIHRLVVHDEDLETLARTHGKYLTSLKIDECQEFSTDGLTHVSKYCNQLRTLCLKSCYHIEVKDTIWLHQLAMNCTGLERFHVTNRDISDAENITLAKNCCNSLISLKIGACYVSELGDAFRYAVRLEHFGGSICDEESDLVGFQFPPNICSLGRMELPVAQYSSVLPLLNQIRKLKLVFVDLNEDQQCLLFKRCPNLEVLYTENDCGDRGLHVIGKFCKKLRKLFHRGSDVTHVGLISLVKECTNLETLDVILENISNEALECVGTHLKNLRDFRILLIISDRITVLPLDDGVRAMLMSCCKLERLDINHLFPGVLTDVGLEYIGRYGVNLRSLSLKCVGISSAGLVKLSQGCQKLRKLKLNGCPYSEQDVTSSVFNIRSLRYVWGYNSDHTTLALTRPELLL